MHSSLVTLRSRSEGDLLGTMSISTSISRVAVYYMRHGLGATIRRTVLATRRVLFSNRAVLFYCDLARQTPPVAELPNSLKVQRKSSYAELDPQDLHQILSVWNPKLAQRRMEERFDQGASLWLIKFEDRLAGYGWTLQGRTIEPHYFPLGTRDVHLFDFHVLPEYRGRGMNPHLVCHILRGLAAESGGRAFIEAAEWNRTQLSSLGRTPFLRFGRARKWAILGHTLVWWAGNGKVQSETDRQSRQVIQAGWSGNVRS